LRNIQPCSEPLAKENNLVFLQLWDIFSPAGSCGIYHIPCHAASVGKISSLSSFGIYPALQKAMGYTLPCSKLRKNQLSIKLWDIRGVNTNKCECVNKMTTIRARRMFTS
jgi:hypothetical protein